MESVITCPPADKSPLAQSVNQLLISGAHADMNFIFDKTDLSHYSACTECKRICDQNVMEIAAHRVIVATRCDWFRRALLSGMKESIERYEGFVKAPFLGCDADRLHIVYATGSPVCSRKKGVEKLDLRSSWFK